MDTKEMIEVMQAFEDGEDIEFQLSDGDWFMASTPQWNRKETSFRIKPKPMEIWVNVYPDSGFFIHSSKVNAESFCSARGRTVHFREVT